MPKKESKKKLRKKLKSIIKDLESKQKQEQTLAVDLSFEELIKLSVMPKPIEKK